MTDIEKNHSATEAVADKLKDLSVDSVDGSGDVAGSNNTNADGSATVFNSIENFNVIHPLTYKWTLWYIKPPVTGQEDWHQLLKEVVTVSSVEEFWGAYNNIPRVSELPVKADYALFKTGIKPEWEDKHNSSGGKWLYQFRKKPVAIDDVWLKVLLSMIGGTLDNDSVETEEVNGAFINVRRAGVKVNLWTKNTSQDNLRPVGLKFKKLLDLGDRDEIEFNAHESGRGKSKVTL